MKKAFFLSSIRCLALAGVVLVFLAGCAGRSALDRDRLFREAMPEADATVADYDALVFDSEGSEIYGQILKPDRSYGTGRPCVLLFHGFAGFARFDDIGQALCRAGCVVVIPHHRGAWGSQGKYTVSNCIQDAVNLVRHVKGVPFVQKYGADPRAVFLVGHSMGGNTVLNAAAQTDGVRGIVMLDPCDIGTMIGRTSPDAMRAFLVDNGLSALRTDGVDAVYGDLVRHAEEYAFPTAVTRLRNTSLLLVVGEWGIDVEDGYLSGFYAQASVCRGIPLCRRQTYPCRHGLMGVRLAVTRDIANFISDAPLDVPPL